MTCTTDSSAIIIVLFRAYCCCDSIRDSGLVCVNSIMRVSCQAWEARYIATTLSGLQYALL